MGSILLDGHDKNSSKVSGSHCGPISSLCVPPEKPRAPDSTPTPRLERCKGTICLHPCLWAPGISSKTSYSPPEQNLCRFTCRRVRAELLSGRQLEQPVKGYLRQQEKPDSTALPCFFNRQPRLVISALTELIYCVAPVKL